MEKIKSKADAKELIRRLVEKEEWITLWETARSIRVITRIIDDGASGYYVHFHEDTTGEEWSSFRYLSEIVDVVWDNRKYINSTPQLRRI